MIRQTAIVELLLRARRAWLTWKLAGSMKKASEDKAPAFPAAQMLDEYTNKVQRVALKLASKEIPLIIAAYPWPENVYDGDGSIPHLNKALEEIGISLLDLTPALRESGLPTTELYLLPHDSHPSPRGYEVTAKALTERITQTLQSISPEDQRER